MGKDILFIFEGKEAREAASELGEILKKEFDFTPWISEIHKGEQLPGRKDAGLLEIAAFIISVPSAIFSIYNLIDRVKNKEKWDNTFSQAKKITKIRNETKIKISLPGETVKEISSVQTHEILEMFTEKEGKK